MKQSLQLRVPGVLRQIYQSLRYSTGGTKRRFGAAGLSNVMLTNALLQVLLHSNLSVILATFCAQVFNAAFGYISYGKIAFRSSLRSASLMGRYMLLAILLWMINWAGIQLFVHFGMVKSLGALLMIFPLALLSYIIQSNWIFNRQ
jgi:hypothetical protein